VDNLRQRARRTLARFRGRTAEICRSLERELRLGATNTNYATSVEITHRLDQTAGKRQTRLFACPCEERLSLTSLAFREIGIGKKLRAFKGSFVPASKQRARAGDETAILISARFAARERRGSARMRASGGALIR